MNILELLTEEFYGGNLAVVYHRTNTKDLHNKIFKGGFKPSDSSWYGSGFYSTYDLKSQDTAQMKRLGDTIVKFAVPIKQFFFFDYEPFRLSILSSKVKADKSNFIEKQLEYYKIEMNVPKTKEGYLSSDMALKMWKKIKPKVKGIVFTGKTDGRVLVSYATSTIYPLAYKSYKDNKWIKIDKNKPYTKKWTKEKTK